MADETNKKYFQRLEERVEQIKKVTGRKLEYSVDVAEEFLERCEYDAEKAVNRFTDYLEKQVDKLE